MSTYLSGVAIISKLCLVIFILFVNYFYCQAGDFPLYRKYSAVFKVCQDRISVRSRLHCGLICSGDSNCVAFDYTDTTNTCTMCNGSNVVGLVFSGTGYVFWKTSAVETSWLNVDSNFVQFKYVTGGLKAGSLVILRGVFLKFPGFTMNFFTTSTDIALHFRTKEGPQLVLNSFKNPNFGVEQVLWFKTFPFSPQREFSVQFLVRADAFLIYIDGVYITTFTHRARPEDIKSIGLFDNVKVFELSY